ncbi:hypothetical protein H4582DRAFT_2060009 [Lactarius indigo]|nr:hypothetical protein H4582DRAFT_2060009 [Lactarius indigo]
MPSRGSRIGGPDRREWSTRWTRSIHTLERCLFKQVVPVRRVCPGDNDDDDNNDDCGDYGPIRREPWNGVCSRINGKKEEFRMRGHRGPHDGCEMNPRGRPEGPDGGREKKNPKKKNPNRGTSKLAEPLQKLFGVFVSRYRGRRQRRKWDIAGATRTEGTHVVLAPASDEFPRSLDQRQLVEPTVNASTMSAIPCAVLDSPMISAFTFFIMPLSPFSAHAKNGLILQNDHNRLNRIVAITDFGMPSRGNSLCRILGIPGLRHRPMWGIINRV